MSVPSRRKLFCSGRAPLIEIFGVRPPTTSLPAASAGVTPVCSSASCWNERPLSGSSRISLSLTRPLSAPDVVLMIGAAPVTVISSAMRPSSSFTSMTAACPTVSRMPRCATGRNPVCDTCRS